MKDEPIPSPFPTKPDEAFWDEVADLVIKYGFNQCAVFVSHKVDNESDEWNSQANSVSDGMIGYIEHTLEHMREHIEEHGPDEQ